MKHFRHILTVLAVCLLQMGTAQTIESGDGGMVTTADGEETVRACQGDEALNFSLMTTSTATIEYAYIVTDDMGGILGFPPANSVMIAGAPVGACRVYGISFSGTLDSTLGINISDLASDGEFELSSNWVTVYRDSVSAGTVNIIGGTDEITAEAGDPALNISVENTATIADQKYAYVITEDNGDILAFPPANMAPIASAPVGVCRVYGFAYTGDIVDSTVTNISELTADGCFELSQNWITTTRTAPAVSGGMVTTADGDETVRACQGDEALNFSLMTTSTATSEYAYIVTDDMGGILGFPPANSVMIAGAPVGVCRVYGISFSGSLDSTLGINISDLASDGEFELSSNWVTVYRDSVSAGTVNIIGGTDEISAEAGDPALNISVENTATIADQKYAYVVTEDNGDILAFPPANMAPIASAPVGVCRVYGFAYTGDIVDSTVTNISELIADGCFELSQNWITTTRTAPAVSGGMVTTADGEETVRACQGDEALNFSLMTTSTATSEYAYIVTDDMGGILGFPPANSVMIAGAPVGACRVYGISFSGTLDSTLGINISDLASDGEFELSSNWVTVYRDSVSAGTVNIIGGTDEITAEAGDPALNISVENTATIADQKYAYVVTEDNGDILAFPPANMAPIASAPVGVCRVYGFAYTGDIVDSTVTNISELTADGCFELSQNWITTTRTPVTSVSELHSKARNLFTVTNNILSVDATVSNYTIYSSQGLGLIESNISQQNISLLNEGVYIIRLNTNEGLLSARFLKQ